MIIAHSVANFLQLLLFTEEELKESVVLEEGGGEVLHHHCPVLRGEAPQGCATAHTNS